MTVKAFFRLVLDLTPFFGRGTGNNNKINWSMASQDELIDIIETVYRGASKGRGLVVSPRGMCRFLLAFDAQGPC